MINVSLSSNLSEKQFREVILDAVAKEVSSAFQKSIPSITQRIQSVCESLILESPTYANLLTGNLLGELGIPDVQSSLRAIIEAIKGSVRISYKPVVRRGNNLSGGLAINVLRDDFSEILSIAAASYVTGKGVSIEWLCWLLTQGDRIVVVDYDVDFTLNPAEKRKSRTGMALMRPGTGYRVNPSFSGTKEYNFITKAFDLAAVEILMTDIIADEINSRIL